MGVWIWGYDMGLWDVIGLGESWLYVLFFSSEKDMISGLSDGLEYVFVAVQRLSNLL